MEDYDHGHNDLYSKAKPESEVIKVPLCTFANDVKTVSTFYFCSCSKEDFFPICEACAKTCHKDHNPSLNIQGIYTCKCGESNHEITPANEATFNQRKQSSANKCFYTKFMEITPNNGFYAHGNKTYCAVCAQYCRKKRNENEVDLLGMNDSQDLDSSELYEDTKLQKVEGINKCVCPKHFEHNVVNLNLDFASKPKFHLQLQNFNFNILSKIGITEEKYLQYLIDKIKEYAQSSSNVNNPELAAEESKDFFSQFINYKILECFSMFATRWENKFFHVKDYFKGIPPKKLISLMPLSENAADINEAIRGDFFSAKFYFAELVFNYLIRTYLLKYNNLWNIRTIINMNLWQRKVYLQEIKQFFKFHSKVEDAYQEDVIEYMINSFLELYDSILIFNDTDNDNSNLQGILFSYIFPTFVRIFKYLIKANLLNQEQSRKYFTLVFDSLKMWTETRKKDEVEVVDEESSNNMQSGEEEEEESEKSQEGNEDEDIKKKINEYEEDDSKCIKSAFYIMKSILYTLIYTNDTISLNYLTYNIDKTNHKFTFCKNPNIEKICKVFMIIINNFYRKEDLNRTIMYDFYVKKILELLVGDGGFYVNSLENCLEIEEYEMKLLTNNDYYLEVKQNIYTPYLDKINNFDLKMGILNRQYFDYGINLQNYIEKTNEVMGELKNFIMKDIEYIPNLNTKYAYFVDVPNINKFKRVQTLQNVIKYTIFFQKMEEYIHIYAEGKTYTFKGDEPLIRIDMAGHKELLIFILKVYYLLMQNNNQIFCLVMNIKPKIFVNCFIDAGDALFDFLERMCEMMFTSTYKFDNFYFFSECLCFIISYVEDYFMKESQSEEQDLIKLGYLGKVFKLATKCITKISISRPDFINVLDSIQHLTQLVRENDNMGRIATMLNSFFSDQNANRSILDVLVNYFLYLSELISNDFNFFSSTSLEGKYIFEVDIVLDKIDDIIKKRMLPIELEYAIVTFYFRSQISFNFTNEKITNQMIRLFKPIKSDDMTNLIKNATLVNLGITSETPTTEDYKNQLQNNIEEFKSYAELLIKLSESFQYKFDNLYSLPKGFDSFFELKIFFYKYFENVIVRPTYKLLNFYLLQGEEIFDKDNSIFSELMSGFLNNITYFYTKLNDRKATKDVFDKTMEKHFNSCENKQEIFEYENISLNKEITNSQLNDIEDDIKTIEEKGSSFDVIYQILIKSIEKIFYMKPNIIESIKTATSVKSKKQVKVPYHILRIQRLIDKYKNKREKTYDTELSLFNAIEVSKKEMDQEIGKDLLQYLLYKLSDTLTDENYTRMTEHYKKGTINGIGLENFKLQNAYILVYLNALFYNYSENFQKYLSECLGECFPQFFEFFSTEIIYSCNLNEIAKIYNLDKIRDYNQITGEKNPTLSGEICCLSIKLLQNMCESHNRIFQNRFFNYKFDINNMKYITNMEEEMDGKEGDINEKLIDSNSVSEAGEKKSSRKDMKDLSKSKTITSRDDRKKGNPNLKSKELKGKGGEDNEQRMELENKIFLSEIKYSFFNFIINNMRLIIDNLNLENSKQKQLLRSSQTIKSIDCVLDIYQRFADLIIEMVQGTQETNFDNFYIRLCEKYQLYNEIGELNYSTLPSFVFLQHCIEMSKTLTESENKFDNEMLPVLLNMFTIIVNVISQEVTDTALIQNLIIILPPEKIITIVSNYLKGLMIKHIKQIEYDDPTFEQEFDLFEFNNKNYSILKNYFKEHLEMYEDEFFKLAGQMYLFLTILGKKYHIAEAERVIRYDEKEIVESVEDQEEGSENEKSISQRLQSAGNLAKDLVAKTELKGLVKKKSTLASFRTKVKHEMNNYIIAARFFNKIIKTCEFMIENEGDMNLKVIYFITDPRAYLISKNNMEKFFDEVDRSSSTTKLKAFIESLNTFMYEVNFKYNTFKKASYLKWMFGIYYKNVDFFNFCCSLAINIMLLFFLDRDQVTTSFVHVLTISMAGFQIFINIIFLTIFLISKYNFYVLLSKSQYEKKKLSLLDYPKIYLFDSFLFNEEVYLIILIIIMGSIGVISRDMSFLFSLQLITVIKFIAIIKDIVRAFQMTLDQVFSMIGFLMIFLFFYSNLGFNFFRDEFNLEIDGGLVANVCSSLLECSITYFNQGVRSGGGIGDLLPAKEFQTAMYWVRWVNDFVFFIVVISLLMNMSSGVIVTTFSKIKEESTAKEEDINNKCFICNIDRAVFEKLKIQFSEHQKNEHNVKNYIRFLIYLKLVNEKDLDADQSFIINCINNNDIKCFPVGRSLSTGVAEEEDEDNGDEEEED